MAPSSDAAEFRKVLASAKSVVFLAGAGLSAGSGIPTYRSANGLWTTNDPNKVATKAGFEADPSLMWQFYHYRREVCRNAKPNAAHTAIAALAIPETGARVFPGRNASKPIMVITQNFDGLSPRALEALAQPSYDGTVPMAKADLEAAQERLIEMHGSAFRTLCTQCITEASLVDPVTIPLEDLPRCGGDHWKGGNRYGACGGVLRPDVVWFGEVPHGLGEIGRELNWTELLIVVGTSALVHPAAGFTKTVRDRGGKVAIFNLERSEGDDLADFLFLGRCEETLPQFIS